MKFWQCTVCKYIHEGDEPPEKCPICGVDASKFVEIDEADIPEKTPKRRKPKPKTEPVVEPPQTIMEKIEAFLCKHHAHPVTVHIPNGVLPFALILWILAWIFKSDLLAKVAVINLLFVITSLPVVIYTGILEWKRKYNGAMTLYFKIKILAATVVSTTCGISIVWYFLDPNILSSSVSVVFLLINLIMLTAAGVAGFIGGKLVFKD